MSKIDKTAMILTNFQEQLGGLTLDQAIELLKSLKKYEEKYDSVYFEDGYYYLHDLNLIGKVKETDEEYKARMALKSKQEKQNRKKAIKHIKEVAKENKIKIKIMKEKE